MRTVCDVTSIRSASPTARRPLVRSLLLAAVFVAPAVALCLSGVHPNPVVSLLAYGAAVVAASFVLAWAAEAAQVDVSGGLAIAVLALIAVLPEYAVDLYYAYVAGHNAEYVQYAAANMTGSNRLLMGIGWPVVVIVGLYVARRMSADQTSKSMLALEPGNRVELGFLLIAGLVAFIIPTTGRIHLVLGVAMLAWFGFYLYKLTRGEPEEPELVGTAAAIGALPDRTRRITVVTLFVVSGAVILLCAEPFANSLINAGTELGVDRFLLVQWLAPIASESPEVLVAITFALRGRADDGMGALLAAKLSQWTLLVACLPIAYYLGGGHAAGLPLDARQTEEFVLTTAQTVLGIAVLINLRLTGAKALLLLGLFLAQFVLPDEQARYIISVIYAGVAVVFFLAQRRDVRPLVTSALRNPQRDASEPRSP